MKEIDYFNIIKYINTFEPSSYVLEHLGEVQDNFDKYLTKLLSLGDNAVDFLMIELYNELLFSNQIEEQKLICPTILLENNLIEFGKQLTNKKIVSNVTKC